MNGEALQTILQTFALLGALAAGVTYLVSQYRRTNCEEAQELAETRGDRIKDLEDHMRRQDLRIAELQGQIDMLRKLKTNEIVDGVVEVLLPFLQPPGG